MSRPYRVLITGSRRWYCSRLALRVMAAMERKHVKGKGDQVVIVHGACPTGVDKAFDDESQMFVPCTVVERHPADWANLDAPGAVVKIRHDGTPYNANAGPARNQKMVDLGADICLAFHPEFPCKGGTADCVRRAIRAGIPTWWTSSDTGRPILLNDQPRFAAERKHADDSSAV